MSAPSGEPGPSIDGSPTAEPSAAEPSAAEPSAAEPSAAEPSAAEPSAAEPEGRAWPWALFVLAVAALVLLPGLGMGVMRPYDEGLYGKLARNALEHGEYLYAVDRDGSLYEGFTKPPLSIALVAASMSTFGVSLHSLRLPFALAMLALVGVCFGWGRRIAGLPMAVAWAGLLVVIAASTRWGRVACIEPLLMLWVTAALWTYHEALCRRGAAALRWAAASGLCLALAFASKQLVVAIALAPIVLLELWRRDGRPAWTRLAIAVSLPVATAIAWSSLMLARHGDAAIEIFLRTGVLQRMTGLSQGHSARSLNELAGIVAEATEPFPWVLGLAGVVVLVLVCPPARRRASGALLLPLLLVTTVVVYDTASQSLLPWYAFDLVVPLTAGLGFLVAGVIGPDPRWRTAGALTLAVGSVNALAPVLPQLLAAVVVGLVLVLGWTLPAPRRDGWLRHARTVLLVGAAIALLAGTRRRPALRETEGGHERLMRIFAERGIERVHVDDDTRIAGEHAWGTYYGPHAVPVGRPPWRNPHEPTPQAYVTAVIWPRELVPPEGGEIVHAPGVMALIGALDRPAWDHATMRSLLQAGPITFEAEDLPSQRSDVVIDDPAASGGAAKALRPYANLPEDAFLLSHGPGVRLPAGQYDIEVWLRWGCGNRLEQPAAVIHVAAGSQALLRHDVPCREARGDTYEPVVVEVDMPRTARIELRVQYISGELWHDRTVVRMRS